MKITYKRIKPAFIYFKIVTIVFFFSLINCDLYSQYANKKVKSKYESYTDSLKQVEYNYVFPFLGQGAYKKGFDIPYPVGIMANYMWMRQGIIIDNLQLGLLTDNRDIPLTDVDFIEFGDNVNTSYTVNVRPDIWLFPFLNVYGIFGYGNSNTEVNLVKPINLQSIVNQNISTSGFGLLTAFGVGPVWVSVDANWTWNKPQLLDKAVNVNVLGLRMGHTFTFKQKPERNFAIWIGGMRAKMGSETVGQIKIADALGTEGAAKRDQIVNDYYDWRVQNYEDLNLAQKKVVRDLLDPIVESIESADGESIIRYSMDKQVKELWNGLIGVQFQLNKQWMFRSEAGIIGDRKSILASINYRFLL